MTREQPTKDTRGAVDKAMSLLRCFTTHDAMGIGLSELARRAELSKTTTHRLLGTLVDNDALERSGDVYRLGPLFFELITERSSKHSELVSEQLTPYLAALFEHTRHTVHLAYLDSTEVVYVNKLFSARGVDAPSRIGGRAPAHCTGVGKAMLAFDEGATETVLASGLRGWTPFTITDPAQFKRELATIHDTGIAYDRQEITLGLNCVAAPIFGIHNVPQAAMSVSGPSDSFDPTRVLPPLRKICLAASRVVQQWQRKNRPEIFDD
ncbi:MULTISPECIES: IclR family transcriptional regulator [unclassified Corynebacterium]|uniref:IclR family transcriptional regulator n=1 Tax=unclassified Corynebacterium TaxID=2624378 RepID=UPI001C4854A6|nr:MULTISPECIES: IclR family transcriptional regulator [unclassified Corynebacterium]MBV7281264.1 IclR family transcriptional regulator [Corynebacterium sp. TAE3-ERU30]MBV7301834.1 IclR family transcriptional regulator [Corynebacterium sp. TAE3-ERU2]